VLRRSKGRKPAEDRQVDRRGVLAAGDDPDFLELLVRLLEREGHEVNRTEETDDALSALMLHPYRAAVVGFTGRSTAVTLLEAIRTHDQPQVATTPVVIVAEDPRNRDFAWQSGVDGYLAKPFHSDELLAEVRAAIERPDDQRDAHRQAQLAAASEGDD